MKTSDVVMGIGLVGVGAYFAYDFLRPNEGRFWVGKLQARSADELKGYFHGLMAYRTKEEYIAKVQDWSNYWYAVDPSLVAYWSRWARQEWTIVRG